MQLECIFAVAAARHRGRTGERRRRLGHRLQPKSRRRVGLPALRAPRRPPTMDTQKLREAFNLFDRDGDGLISRAELDSVLKSVGANSTSEEEVCGLTVLAASLHHQPCDTRVRC